MFCRSRALETTARKPSCGHGRLDGTKRWGVCDSTGPRRTGFNTDSSARARARAPANAALFFISPATPVARRQRTKCETHVLGDRVFGNSTHVGGQV